MIKNGYLGVDGCKAGWFFVAIGPDEDAEFGFYKDIGQLYEAYQSAKCVLVDIPIGLPSKTNPIRRCDKEARKVLKPIRHNSVFSPPCRAAVLASSYK